MATMTRDEARQAIRENWRSIITGITSPAKIKVNHETSYICPFCGHGSHGDGMSYIPKSKGGDGNTLKCFGCDFTGDILDVYMKYYGADYNTALSSLSAEMGITIEKPDTTPGGTWKQFEKPAESAQIEKESMSDKMIDESEKTAQNSAENATEPNYTEYYRQCRERLNDPAAAAYLKDRGISIETARKYWIGFDPQADPANNPGGMGESKFPTPRIIIPTTPAHYVGRAIDPNTEKRYIKMNAKDSTPGIFNLKTIYSQEVQEVFVTEGGFDALSILEAGEPAIALNSTSNRGLFLETLQENPATVTFIICMDNDSKGQIAAQEIETGLDLLHIRHITANICGDHKDANEALTADREKFSADVQAAKRSAQPDTGRGVIDSFLEAIYTEKYKPVPTGISAIDDALNGGMIPQTLVFLGAEPGAGKTALATMIFESMARNGHRAIYYNLEMSREQLIARSLARIVYVQDHSHKLNALDVLQGYKQTDRTRSLVNQAAQEYKETIADYLDYNPGEVSADVDSILQHMEKEAQRAKKEGRPAPNICIDYLQIMTGKPKEDAAEIIKRAVAGMKDYARKYSAIVFCIMAQSRRVNDSNKATLSAGRDTSAIEYSGDLQLQLLKDEDKNPGKVNLCITKSRFTQTKMEKDGVVFRFHGGQSYFEETGDRWNTGESQRAGRRIGK